MKTINKRTVFCLLLIGALLTACGNKTAGDAQKLAKEREAALVEQLREEEESESSYDYTIEPVFVNGNEDGDPVFFTGAFRSFTSIWYAVRDSSGNLVQFDNDADYSELCSIIGVIKNAGTDGYYSLSKDLHEKYNLEGRDAENDTNEFRDYLKKYKDKVDEMNKQTATYWLSLIDAAQKYMNGDKDKISDPKFFQIIDKAYYDKHPNQHYYVESESRYNYKKYVRDDGKGVVYAKPNEPSEMTLDHVLSDGTLVPRNVLILD